MIQEAMPREDLAPGMTVDYRNPGLSVRERVADLLARMTLDEKIAQMICIWGQRSSFLFDDDGRPSASKISLHLKNGVGQIARLSDFAGGLSPRAMAELANAIQRAFVEHTRLGIPVIFHEECLHGLAAKDATSYPQPIGLAATFNPELVESIYASIAEDARSRGAHQALTPVVDVARDPRWGRVEETFGEDPYLVAQMGISAVRGFQGDATFRDGKRIVATLKHFAAHGQPESGMNCGPVNVSERLLRDVFLYPFREVIRKTGVSSVMASYNEIDGVPSHANRWLLRDVLRDEWGFTGVVVSDYYAITELHSRPEATSHSVARDKAEAALLSVEAGVNIELPDSDCYPFLSRLVREGRIRESQIDELVAPMLAQKFQLGLFDDPYVDPDSIRNGERLERERALALQAAHETITLLKNEGGILPLAVKPGAVLAVIGPNAHREMLGGYSGTPAFHSSVVEGIREKVGSTVTVLTAEGCRITVGGSWNQDAVVFPDPAEDRRMIQEAVAAAQKADVAVLVLGGNEQTSREAWSRAHMGDRANLDLVGSQMELVKAIRATGRPIVVVLINGRPKSIGELHSSVAALLECWYLGQESGRAVADVLFGDVNPSGKLPISFPRSAGHLPCFYNHKPSARRGYLGEEVTPLYAFGYGLSYTTFALRNLRLARSSIRRDESTAALVDVQNTGTREGAEVVQMYIRDLVSSVTRPVKELRGFQKIRLAPGETRTVSLPILPDHLAFTTIAMEYAVEAGDFAIMVGTSSQDEDLATTILHVTD